MSANRKSISLERVQKVCSVDDRGFLKWDQQDSTFFEETLAQSDQTISHEESIPNQIFQENQFVRHFDQAFEDNELIEAKKKYRFVSVSEEYQKVQELIETEDCFGLESACYINFLIKKDIKRKKYEEARRKYFLSILPRCLNICEKNKKAIKEQTGKFSSFKEFYECECGNIYFWSQSFQRHQRESGHKARHLECTTKRQLKKAKLKISSQDSVNPVELFRIFSSEIKFVQAARKAQNVLSDLILPNDITRRKSDSLSNMENELFGLYKKLVLNFHGKTQIHLKNMTLSESLSLFKLLLCNTFCSETDKITFFVSLLNVFETWVDDSVSKIIQTKVKFYPELVFYSWTKSEEECYSANNDCYLIELLANEYLQLKQRVLFNKKQIEYQNTHVLLRVLNVLVDFLKDLKFYDILNFREEF